MTHPAIRDKPVTVPAFTFVMPIYDLTAVGEFIPCGHQSAIGYDVFEWNHRRQRWGVSPKGRAFDLHEHRAAILFARARHVELCAKWGVNP